MGYSGPARTQYIISGGLPIDLMQARTLLDPTPALLSLFTDIDRLQWGVFHDWGNPPTYINVETRDGGVTGSSGSIAAVDKVIAVKVEVPPMVTHANVCALTSGAIQVKIQEGTVDTTGILIQADTGAGAVSHLDIEAASIQWASGVSANSPAALEARAIKVNTEDQAQGITRTFTVTVTRTDVSPTLAGYGGILWGLGFQWVRPPLDTFKPGTDTAESASV